MRRDDDSVHRRTPRALERGYWGVGALNGLYYSPQKSSRARDDFQPIREQGNVLECGSRSCRFCMPRALLEQMSGTWRSGTLASSPAGVAGVPRRHSFATAKLFIGTLSRPTTGGGETPRGQPARRRRSACCILTLASTRSEIRQPHKTTAGLHRHSSLPVAYESGSCGYRTPSERRPASLTCWLRSAALCHGCAF